MQNNSIESLKKSLVWGTYGKSGTDPLEYIRLIDCASDHLKNILKAQLVDKTYQAVIKSILSDRGASLEEIPQDEFKRNNWTNEEVIQFLNGQKLSYTFDINSKRKIKVDEHNAAIEDCIEVFKCFQFNIDIPGAMAYNKTTGFIEHIGPAF